MGETVVNVLIDIEWVKENEGSSITQFAAVRVLEDWKTVAVFERLVCPGNLGDIDWGNMAYSGYSPEEFQRGVSEKVCISDFIGFLDDCDTILCWHGDTKHLLKQKVVQFLGKPLSAKCKCVNQAVYTIAKSKGIASYGLYEVAEEIGITTLKPKHRSTNDVVVMQRLLSALGYGKKAAPKGMQDEPKKKADRRERNVDILSRAEYNYIYTPNSKVFHRPSCHLMRNAIDINGSVYYKTAIKGRVPCRVCRPEPNERPKKAKAKAEQEKNVSSQPIERKLISARLLGDQWIEITNVKIVGCCHNRIHPGKLTRKLMGEHDCLGKNCKFFE